MSKCKNDNCDNKAIALYECGTCLRQHIAELEANVTELQVEACRDELVISELEAQLAEKEKMANWYKDTLSEIKMNSHQPSMVLVGFAIKGLSLAPIAIHLPGAKPEKTADSEQSDHFTDAGKKVCEWKPNRHCHDTSCGVELAHMHLGFKYCPHCGKPIQEKGAEDDS